MFNRNVGPTSVEIGIKKGSLSRSAPGTPLPLSKNSPELSGKDQLQKDKQNSISRKPIDVISSSIEKTVFGLENLSQIEAAAVNLRGAVDLGKDLLAKDQSKKDNPMEGVLSIRTICKGALELANIAKTEITREKERLIVEGMACVSELCDTILKLKGDDTSSGPYPSETFSELGIEHCVCWVIGSLTEKCEDVRFRIDHFKICPSMISMNTKDKNFVYSLWQATLGETLLTRFLIP
jgi:hypothetical protein